MFYESLARATASSSASVDGYGDEKDFVCPILHHDLCHRWSFYLVQRTFSMRYIKYFFITAGLLILGLGIYRPAKSQEGMKLHAVQVGMNSVMPSGDVVGFSCAAGLQDAEPRCYALIKER